MYAGRDFDPAQPVESMVFGFDFVKDLQVGDQVTAATWSCSVSPSSDNPDDAAASCVIGQAAVLPPTQTTQRIANLKAGVIYNLQADVTTQLGDKVSLWARVECQP